MECIKNLKKTILEIGVINEDIMSKAKDDDILIVYGYKGMDNLLLFEGAISDEVEINNLDTLYVGIRDDKYYIIAVEEIMDSFRDNDMTSDFISELISEHIKKTLKVQFEYTNNNWIIDIIPPLGKSVAIEYFETDAVSGILVK